MAAASGPFPAADLFRAPGSGFLSTGLAAGFSFRAPRQPAPAPKPDSWAILTGPVSWGRNGSSSLWMPRPGGVPGAGGRRPATSWCWPRCRNPRRWAPAWWSGAASHPPRMLNNPGTFNRPRYLAADGLFREMRLPDPEHLIFLASTEAYPWAERLRGGIRERLRAWTRPAGPSIWPCCWGTRAKSPRRCARILPAPAPATCWSSTACTWAWWPRSPIFSVSGSCGASPGCC